MQIHIAELADLNACLTIDDSFETEFVWQMEEQNRLGTIAVSFRTAHLPRPMRVNNIISHEELAADFYNGATLFVADEGGVRGYLDVVAHPWNQAAYINNLAVAHGYRRKGVGGQLMDAALDWARQQKLRVIMLDTSTKDYPAISFYLKQGFSFCGFNDQLYPNRDIALYFSLNLH